MVDAVNKLNNALANKNNTSQSDIKAAVDKANNIYVANNVTKVGNANSLVNISGIQSLDVLHTSNYTNSLLTSIQTNSPLMPSHNPLYTISNVSAGIFSFNIFGLPYTTLVMDSAGGVPIVDSDGNLVEKPILPLDGSSGVYDSDGNLISLTTNLDGDEVTISADSSDPSITVNNDQGGLTFGGTGYREEDAVTVTVTTDSGTTVDVTDSPDRYSLTIGNITFSGGLVRTSSGSDKVPTPVNTTIKTLTGITPPDESIDIVSMGGASIAQLVGAVEVSAARKLSLIDQISSVAGAVSVEGLSAGFLGSLATMKETWSGGGDSDTGETEIVTEWYGGAVTTTGTNDSKEVDVSLNLGNEFKDYIRFSTLDDKKASGKFEITKLTDTLRDSADFKVWLSETKSGSPVSFFGKKFELISNDKNPLIIEWTQNQDKFGDNDPVFSGNSAGAGARQWTISEKMKSYYLNFEVTTFDAENAVPYDVECSFVLETPPANIPQRRSSADSSAVENALQLVGKDDSSLLSDVTNAAVGVVTGSALVSGIIDDVAGDVLGVVDDALSDFGDIIETAIDTGFGTAQDLFEDLTGSVASEFQNLFGGAISIGDDIVNGILDDLLDGSPAAKGNATKTLALASNDFSPQLKSIIATTPASDAKTFTEQVSNRAASAGISADEISNFKSNIDNIESALDKVNTTIAGQIVSEVGDYYTEDTDLAELVKRYLRSQTESFPYVDSKEELGLEFTKVTRDISEVIVHASETYTNANIGSEELHIRHNEAGHDGIQYHYVIRRDGRLQRGVPLDNRTDASNVRGHKEVSVDVCLIGGVNVPSESENPLLNRSAQSFTQAQMKTLEHLLEVFYQKYPGGQVLGHNSIDASNEDPYFDVITFVENKFGKKSVYNDPLTEPALKPTDIIKKKPV